MPALSVSIENFLKAVYKQSKISGAGTKIGTLAGTLHITSAAATDMARKLAEKELVNYVRYKPLTLTSKGNKLALNVIRKHRLWEAFLYKTLNLSMHEIHREAEVLEHLTSDFLVDKIDTYLGNPASDPHGDPIPTCNGYIETDNTQILLSKASAGHTYEVCRLFSSEKEFFDFCSSNKISVGSNIWIEKQYDLNKMTEIIINKDKILLSKELTNVIYVKRI
jgi:DtxR family Mn-dependent transcriptional regulator